MYTLGTHSDWYYHGGCWGKPGLQRVADLCLEAGINRLYWRTHDGGQAKYPSRVGSINDGARYRSGQFQGLGTLPESFFNYRKYLDYSQWDQLTDMAEIASSVGLPYSHWYTIHEDDHGGNFSSAFLENHPEFQCRTRDGQAIPGCLDFWFPEVRNYKRAIVEELLAKPAERLLLDFLRRNGTPSADFQGHYRYGYNPEKLEAFRRETGLDALKLTPSLPEWSQWLQFNARPMTEFVLEIADLARRVNRPLDLLLWPVDQLAWMAFDLPALARAGAVHDVLIGSHTYAFSAAEARRQVEAMRPQLEGTAARMAPGLPAYYELPAEGFDRFVGEVERQGCDRMVLFESHALINSPLVERIRAASLDKSHHSRAVLAIRTEGSPDWARVPVQTGFLRAFAFDDGQTDQETSFQVAHDGQSLYFRFICRERTPQHLIPVPQYDHNNYNVAQLGYRMYWNPHESIHLALDFRHQHEDFVCFTVDPANDAHAGTWIDEVWLTPWQHTTHIGPDRWEVELTLPLASLEIDRPSGKILGFQAVRVQDRPREVSSWFNSKGRRLQPLEFGHLTLE